MKKRTAQGVLAFIFLVFRVYILSTRPVGKRGALGYGVGRMFHLYIGLCVFMAYAMEERW